MKKKIKDLLFNSKCTIKENVYGSLQEKEYKNLLEYVEKNFIKIISHRSGRYTIKSQLGAFKSVLYCCDFDNLEKFISHLLVLETIWLDNDKCTIKTRFYKKVVRTINPRFFCIEKD